MQLVFSSRLQSMLPLVCSEFRKDLEREESTVSTLQCDAIILEEETSLPLNLSKDKCAKTYVTSF